MTEKYSDAGDKNLLELSNADNFTNWMYSEIKPFLNGNILEIGSGIGTYSEKIINDFKNRIILSDIDPEYVKKLKIKFKENKKVDSLKIDITKKQDLQKIKSKINSVFALNVLEHIEDDVTVLNNIYDLLEKKGKFVILVPAHKFLYNCIDKAIGHYRRYTKKEIIKKISKTKFKIKKIFYFNSLSIPAWFINGNVLKKEILVKGGMNLLNKLVPFIKFFEKYILMKKIGISLILVLEKE